MAETSHQFIDVDSPGTSEGYIAKDKGTFFIYYGRGFVFDISRLEMESLFRLLCFLSSWTYI